MLGVDSAYINRVFQAPNVTLLGSTCPLFPLTPQPQWQNIRIERPDGIRYLCRRFTAPLHKDRLGEVKSNEARTDVRFKAIQGGRKIERMDYRLTVTEQTTSTTAGLSRSCNRR